MSKTITGEITGCFR